MLRPRLVPVLLLDKRRLINTQKFKESRYLGDPINAIKLFNDLMVDEILILDRSAGPSNEIDYNYLERLAARARSPIGYGGGVRTTEQAVRVSSLGFEKVAFCTSALSNPSVLSSSSQILGRQSVICCLNIKTNPFTRRLSTFSHSDAAIGAPLETTLSRLYHEDFGELLLYSQALDGSRSNYDLKLLSAVHTNKDHLPIITICGGLSSSTDLLELHRKYPYLGFAGTSFFVYSGPLDAVLISYQNPFF